MTPAARARRAMVRRHLAKRGITDRRVLAAMTRVPREAFLDPAQEPVAYADAPLSIGCGQTISQPYIVALMTEAAGIRHPTRVLEIGTGSGYHTAILAHLAGHVWSVERHDVLARAATRHLHDIGCHNVTIVVGDGASGYPTAAPYDAIVVSAAAPEPPPALVAQLADAGRLVIPLGDRTLQMLTVVTRTADGIRRREVCACRFVPLVSPVAFAE
ncbi:MAG TPA: protein-L-isoaspartate(D-aspartate) O-methyltransferase [Gemmatimonadales bacterium]